MVIPLRTKILKYSILEPHLSLISHACMHAKSLQLGLTLCRPMDCSLQGSSVHEILQARIKRQPTPVPLPGESHGGRSLVGYSPWGRKESDMTERLHFTSLQSLGRKDPLEEGTAAHCSILAWRFPWTEEPGGLQSLGSQRVGHD